MNKEIKTLIAQGEIEKVLEIIQEEIILIEDEQLKNDFILQSARLRRVLREKNLGITPSEQSNLIINQITAGILSLANKIENKKLNKKKLNKKSDFEKALDIIHSKSIKYFSEKNRAIRFTRDNLEESINNHRKEVNAWCKEIKIRILAEPKKIEKIYVHLKYYLTPKRFQYEGTLEHPEKIFFDYHLSSSERNTIILGQPGAGKTTSIKYITHQILTNSDFCQKKFNLPIVIRFRELGTYGSSTFKKNEGIFDRLYTILGFVNIEDWEEKNKWIVERIVLTALEELRALVILDGFDEYPYEDKEKVVNEIKTLSRNIVNSKFILTSRTVEFPYTIPNSDSFEIALLDDKQIKIFAKTWLKDEELSKAFLHQLMGTTYIDTARRPLTLSHLITIFNKSNPKQIPRKPKSIYSTVVDLLIKDWDEERNIIRKAKNSNFQHERKKAFLCKLSFYLTKKYYGSSFSQNTIRSTYIDLCESFGLPKEDSHEIVRELESHSGLFIKSGKNKYEFAHKSIQEYFTAEYLKGLPVLSNKHIKLEKIPNELAILVAIASEPNEYFSVILKQMFKNKFNPDFIDTYLNRIHLENPDFLTEHLLGYNLLWVFDDLYYQLTQSEEILLQNGIRVIDKIIRSQNSFSKSITQLEKYYIIEPESARKISESLSKNQSLITMNDVITLLPREHLTDSKNELESNPYSKILKSKLFYIKNWIYVHPLYKQQYIKN